MFRIVAAAACASALVACTFLVTFDDEPSCDGGQCGDGGPRAHDGDDGRDGGRDDGRADGRADARSVDDGGGEAYAPCANLTAGEYCANDGLHGYAGSPDDLVRCADGGIDKVTPCDGGCLAMPNPFPDACNPCVGRADASYCGRDLAGFPSKDADFLIQCQKGNVVQKVACAHGCNSSATPPACSP